MTDTQINIAIAQACPSVHRMYYSPDWKHDWPNNYCTDLNAMHEAENTLSNDEWDDKFYYWLGAVVSGGATSQLWEYRKAVVHANARQRAEAFLRTIGKWVEETVHA